MRLIPYTLSYKCDGKASTSLTLILRWSGQRVDIGLGIRIDPARFDGERAKPRTLHGTRTQPLPAERLNERLQFIEGQTADYFHRCESQDHVPTRGEVKKFVSYLVSGRDSAADLVYDLFTRFISTEGRKKEWSYRTARSAAQVRDILHVWNPSLRARDISNDTLREFERWQHSHTLKSPGSSFCPDTRASASGEEQCKGYQVSTIKKHMSVLSWFTDWLTAEGYLQPGAVGRVRVKAKAIPRPVIHLTPEELGAIVSLDLDPSSRLSLSRDILLFCCYSGLRFSDVTTLDWSTITADHILGRAKKTGKPLRIDLNPVTRALLSKYASLASGSPSEESPSVSPSVSPSGSPSGSPSWPAPSLPCSGGSRDSGEPMRTGRGEGSPRPWSGLVFPPITDHWLNHDIKELGRMAGIDEPTTVTTSYAHTDIVKTVPKWQLLSSHVGRRSFAVMALSAGVPEAIVRSWTGHSSPEAMRPYTDILNCTRAAQMQTLPLPQNLRLPEDLKEK